MLFYIMVYVDPQAGLATGSKCKIGVSLNTELLTGSWSSIGLGGGVGGSTELLKGSWASLCCAGEAGGTPELLKGSWKLGTTSFPWSGVELLKGSWRPGSALTWLISFKKPRKIALFFLSSILSALWQWGMLTSKSKSTTLRLWTPPTS